MKNLCSSEQNNFEKTSTLVIRNRKTREKRYD